jgi:S1-C subfamily serine protease
VTNRDGVTRRRVLGLLGASAVGSLAGCATVRVDDDAPVDDDGSVYTGVYEAVVPSVAQVNVETSAGGGQGTGWMFDDGTVVTNEHVVAGATEVEVRFGDGAIRPTEMLGADPYSDLAALAPDSIPNDVDPLSLVEEPARPGERCVIVGSPFGLTGSVTAGIVSGIDRLIPAPAGFPIPDTVQTDAAANPGNSGGPLVDLDGNVIAVINSGGGDNIAFGISVALTRRVIPALRDDGRYRHPYLGVTLSPVTSEVAEEAGLDRAVGLVVSDVIDGGPADGRLRIDDVIVRIDDAPIRVLDDLATYLALNTRPGDEIEVLVVRDGTRQTVTVEVGARPPPEQAPDLAGAAGSGWSPDSTSAGSGRSPEWTGSARF